MTRAKHDVRGEIIHGPESIPVFVQGVLLIRVRLCTQHFMLATAVPTRICHGANGYKIWGRKAPSLPSSRTGMEHRPFAT